MKCIDPFARCWNKAQTFAYWKQNHDFMPTEPPGWLTCKFGSTHENMDAHKYTICIQAFKLKHVIVSQYCKTLQHSPISGLKFKLHKGVNQHNRDDFILSGHHCTWGAAFWMNLPYCNIPKLFRDMGINNSIFVRGFKSQKILLNMVVSHYAFLLTSHFLSLVLWWRYKQGLLPSHPSCGNRWKKQKLHKKGLLTSLWSFSILWPLILSTASWKLLSHLSAPDLQRRKNK